VTRGGALAALLAVLLLGGCGAESPGESVPSLVEGVAKVDAAVVAGDRDEARSALESLVDDAEAAVADGRLAQAEADSVVTAAEALLSELDDPSGPATEPTTEPEEPSEPTEPAGPTEPPTDDGPGAQPPDKPEKEPKPEKPDKPDKPGKPDEDDEDDDD
jgi:outer membrane biosynthesis protein TonB